MKKQDPSKEIFEKYYMSKNKILLITLNDDSILEGIFVSFVYGDRDFDEPYIITWHFVPLKDIERHSALPQIDFGEEYGKIIKQQDIKSVKFKV